MNAASFDCRSDSRQWRRLDRDRLVEEDCRTCLFRFREGDRQPRDIAFFAAEAGPERRFEDRGELAVRRQVRQVAVPACPCVVQMVREMRLNCRCNPACRGVGKVSQKIQCEMGRMTGLEPVTS